MTTIRYFAEVIEGIVARVIVADQDFIDTGSVGNRENWIETSTAIRKNRASGGYTYDSARDAFIPVKQFSSWVLDETTCRWKAPVAKPRDGKYYRWNEAALNWAEIIVTPENQAVLALAYPQDRT